MSPTATLRNAATAATERVLRTIAPRSQLRQLLFGPARAEPSPILLRQRRVYVLPTLHGVSFALALALMLVGSINYALSLGFLLTFLLAGLILVALAHTYRNLWHLNVSAGRTEPVFAGSVATATLYFENRSRYDRFGLVARARDSRRGLAHHANVDVPAGGIVAARFGMDTIARGWLEVGRITVETRYPLGLFRTWAYVQPGLRILVYPQPQWTDLPPEALRPEAGDRIEIGLGNDDFAGLRPHTPSDSPRHIAWKIAARTDTLVVKQWSGRGAAELWLDWRYCGDAPIETRLSRLTGWVLKSETDGRLYGLQLPQQEIKPGHGPAHRDECLKALALYGQPPTAAHADR